MSMHRSAPPLSIGFLTVVRQVEHGYVGGYLIVNQLARPIEFHCTVPVKPNRAQEILYGRTLEPYLLGEQIGATLIGKSSSPPLLVCTDQPAVLAAQGMVEVPVALVVAGAVPDGFAAPGGDADAPSYPADGFPPQATIALYTGHAPAAASAGHTLRDTTIEAPRSGGAAAAHRGRLRWGGYELRFEHLEPAAYAEIESRLHELPPDFDLCEPFERIREAVAEAQRCTAA